jgi:hypothetical protein
MGESIESILAGLTDEQKQDICRKLNKRVKAEVNKNKIKPAKDLKVSIQKVDHHYECLCCGTWFNKSANIPVVSKTEATMIGKQNFKVYTCEHCFNKLFDMDKKFLVKYMMRRFRNTFSKVVSKKKAIFPIILYLGNPLREYKEVTEVNFREDELEVIDEA